LTVIPKRRDALGHPVLAKAALQNLRAGALAAAGRAPESAASSVRTNKTGVHGRMKGWNRWADLPKIKVRTLTMGARYDEMDAEDMRRMALFYLGEKRGSHKQVVISRCTTISKTTLEHSCPS
jgi:hypothetical protein